MITSTRKVRFVRRPDKFRAIKTAQDAPETTPAERVPRISRLMALAIHFDRLIREGKVADQSELARLAHVTQPRMTQVMNLNHLAPDIQEHLLHLTAPSIGRSPTHERSLREVVQFIDWRMQRSRWHAVAIAPNRPTAKALSAGGCRSGADDGPSAPRGRMGDWRTRTKPV